ncbi:MAG: peroxiredoxin [Devosia sp.]|uniref:peroxiredoxin n=1 Tax=Devosia sp. TaxID=1871048 RepID=UPI001AC47879|nr:peroxiredoxin [Devosia sp.]MBN9309953.1 peroxiredoxin [Devosia sp.]MBN9314367.1 peroxiredoxin [Devosia sp.]
MTLVTVGAPAPDFQLTTDASQQFRLSDHRGHPVVLYFYPQDDTEGCTLENIEFTDQMPEFRRLGAVVVGISPDSVEKHCSFRDKFNLGVTLAADPERKAIEAYGVWQLKKMFGVEFMGVKRVTVLVGPDGNVAGVFPATRIKGHAAKVLEATRELVARRAGLSR